MNIFQESILQGFSFDISENNGVERYLSANEGRIIIVFLSFILESSFNSTAADNTAPDDIYQLETDAFVAKFSSRGDHEWTKEYITTSSDYAKSIEIDSEGNSYIVGFSEDSPDDTLFLRKYDPDGGLLWTTTTQEGGNLRPYDLVLSDDLVIVTGASTSNIFASAFFKSTGEFINTSFKIT